MRLYLQIDEQILANGNRLTRTVAILSHDNQHGHEGNSALRSDPLCGAKAVESLDATDHQARPPVCDDGRSANSDTDTLSSVQLLDKELYTTKETAQVVGRSQFQVGKWCREQRVRCEKQNCRGKNGQWFIPKDEVVRLLRERCKLLPIPKKRRFSFRAS